MTTNMGEITKDFAPDVAEKGRRYFSAKRVSRIEFDVINSTISGIVKEDNNALLAVNILVKSTAYRQFEITASCECGSSLPCHHAAALLAAIGGADSIIEFLRDVAEQEAFFVRHPDQRPAPPASVPAAPAPPVEEPLPWHLQEWQAELLNMTDSLNKGTGSGKKSSDNSQIIYILHPSNSTRHSLIFGIFRSTIKKNNRIGNLRSYDPFYRQHRAAFIKDDDMFIFRMLSGISMRSGLTAMEIVDEFTTQLLEKMIATGRCFFMGTEGSPLSWGRPRVGKADWITEADMRQRTCIRVEPEARVFCGTPMIYLDIASFTVGHITMDIPPRVAQKWLSAPAIEPRYHKAMAKFSTATSLPAPPPIPEAQAIYGPPKPVLQLHSALWRAAAGFVDPLTADIEDYFHWGEIYFDYDVVRLNPNAQEKTFDIFFKAKRYLVVRDLPNEKDRIAKIKHTGMHLASVPDVMRPYGQEEVPVWVLDQSDAEAWQSWMAGPMKQLQLDGWIIDYAPSCKLRRAMIDDWFMDTTASDDENNWFNVDLGIVVDGQRISLIPLLRKVFASLQDQSANRFLLDPLDVPLPDGRYVRLPPERMARIRDLLLELFDANDDTGVLRADRLRAAQFAGVDGWHWTGSQQVRDLVERIRTASTTATPPPPGLAATLRPYQQHGLTWLQFLRDCGLSGVLADDMGLGKTVQALAHLLCEKQAGRLDRPALVVAPTSLMGNWRQETQRFAPDLRILVLHGSGRKEHFEKLDQYDLIVTSYQLLARDEAFLTKQPYHQVILDEAQMVKNPSTQYAQAARKLVTRHRLALTGTPMENHLGELWAIFDFLMPGFLGNNRQFRQLFRDPIEKAGDAGRRKALAQRIAPLVLRRRKSEVALELPPKNEMVQEIEITGGQRDLYESIRVTMESQVRDQIANMGLARSHIFILDALLKLRQVCCDPRLLKLSSAKKVTESAKLDWLSQTLPSMIEDGRKILLFSQFTSMLELIERKLAELKINFVRLTGDTRDRETPVQSFQRGDVPLFLISLKAGGTGLNLTAADTVIHYDPWWNPAVENQATDRAHRIGQDKTVFVYKLITQGTVEEKIQALQNRKRDLVAGLLDDTGQTPLKLGDDELKALFAPLA
jgi:superfamily II DNA or RNA helicase